MVNKINRLFRKSSSREGGFALDEILIGVAILSIIGIGLFSALGTSVKGVSQTDTLETAKNLAITQMEYAKGLDYQSSDSYPAAPIPDEYPGYSATINTGAVASRDSNIQQIIVTISYQGEEILTLEDYKHWAP